MNKRATTGTVTENRIVGVTIWTGGRPVKTDAIYYRRKTVFGLFTGPYNEFVKRATGR